MNLSFLQTAILVSLGASALVIFLIPKINNLIHYKQLLDNPNDRSSHKFATPNLGGVAFFVSTMISFYFITSFDDTNTIISLIPGLTIIFILGLKDDLVVLSPFTKLIGQIVAAIFLVFHYRFAIQSFHGFIGIDSLPVLFSIPLAMFIMVAIMNSINLIDGIDGLAASISVIIFATYAFLFYKIGLEFFVLISLTMIGSLTGFLFYNFNH